MIYTTATIGNYSPNTNPVQMPVPFPVNLDGKVEFGKVYEMPLSATQDEVLVHASYGTLLSDFFKTKKESFPNWHELPEIKSLRSPNSYSIAWYIAVPQDQVYAVDQKVEDALWES